MRSPSSSTAASDNSAEKAEPIERGRSIEIAIHALLDTLTAAECQTVLTRLQAQRPANPTPRAGAVLEAVVHVLERERARRAKWSVAEIKEAVKSDGVSAHDKQFYNAVSYLARKGRIEKIGYGRYRLVDYGVVIETSDELT